MTYPPVGNNIIQDNRTACLRLTERCGVILATLKEEMEGTERMIVHLQRPYERLNE